MGEGYNVFLLCRWILHKCNLRIKLGNNEIPRLVVLDSRYAYMLMETGCCRLVLLIVLIEFLDINCSVPLITFWVDIADIPSGLVGINKVAFLIKKSSPSYILNRFCQFPGL